MLTSSSLLIGAFSFHPNFDVDICAKQRVSLSYEWYPALLAERSATRFAMTMFFSEVAVGARNPGIATSLSKPFWNVEFDDARVSIEPLQQYSPP